MIKINLLAVKATQQGAGIKVQVVLAVVALVAVAGVCAYFKVKIDAEATRVAADIQKTNQETENLKKIIGEIDKIKERKADLQKKLSVIDDLERGRLTTVKAMEAIARATPDQLWFNRMEYKGGNVIITGFALDNQIIARLIQNLNANSAVGNVVLTDSSRSTIRDLEGVTFNIQFTIRPNDSKQG